MPAWTAATASAFAFGHVAPNVQEERSVSQTNTQHTQLPIFYLALSPCPRFPAVLSFCPPPGTTTLMVSVASPRSSSAKETWHQLEAVEKNHILFSIPLFPHSLWDRHRYARPLDMAPVKAMEMLGRTILAETAAADTLFHEYPH